MYLHKNIHISILIFKLPLSCFRCIATNAAGSTDRIAIITVRRRPTWPEADKLTVSPVASSISEGQSTRLVCTGTTNVPAGTIDWVR